jgi:hypothetical protein
LALTSPTSGGRLVGIVRLQTQATEFVIYLRTLFCNSDCVMLSGRIIVTVTAYWKGSGSKQPWIGLKYYPSIRLEGQKDQKTSVGVAAIHAKIQAMYIQDTSQRHYCLNQYAQCQIQM